MNDHDATPTCKDHVAREPEILFQTGTSDASDDGTWTDIDMRWPMGVRMSVSGETRVVLAEESQSLPGIDGAANFRRIKDGALCLPKLAPVNGQKFDAKFSDIDTSPSPLASSGLVSQTIGFQRCKERSDIIHVHTILPCVQAHRKSPSKHAQKSMNTILAREFVKVMRSTSNSVEENGRSQVHVVSLPHALSRFLCSY
jgi:hypothetical protein